MQEAARAIKRRCSFVTSMALTGRSMEGPCMVCGGSAEVLVAYVPPGDPELLAVCTAMSQALRERRRVWLFTFFAGEPGECEVSYCLLGDDGELVGRAPVGAADLRQLVGKSHVHGSAKLADGREAYVEPVDPPSVAVICGAGHVAAGARPGRRRSRLRGRRAGRSSGVRQCGPVPVRKQDRRAGRLRRSLRAGEPGSGELRDRGDSRARSRLHRADTGAAHPGRLHRPHGQLHQAQARLQGARRGGLRARPTSLASTRRSDSRSAPRPRPSWRSASWRR